MAEQQNNNASQWSKSTSSQSSSKVFDEDILKQLQGFMADGKSIADIYNDIYPREETENERLIKRDNAIKTANRKNKLAVLSETLRLFSDGAGAVKGANVWSRDNAVSKQVNQNNTNIVEANEKYQASLDKMNAELLNARLSDLTYDRNLKQNLLPYAFGNKQNSTSSSFGKGAPKASSNRGASNSGGASKKPAEYPVYYRDSNGNPFIREFDTADERASFYQEAALRVNEMLAERNSPAYFTTLKSILESGNYDEAIKELADKRWYQGNDSAITQEELNKFLSGEYTPTPKEQEKIDELVNNIISSLSYTNNGGDITIEQLASIVGPTIVEGQPIGDLLFIGEDIRTQAVPTPTPRATTATPQQPANKANKKIVY